LGVWLVDGCLCVQALLACHTRHSTPAAQRESRRARLVDDGVDVEPAVQVLDQRVLGQRLLDLHAVQVAGVARAARAGRRRSELRAIIARAGRPRLCCRKSALSSLSTDTQAPVSTQAPKARRQRRARTRSCRQRPPARGRGPQTRLPARSLRTRQRPSAARPCQPWPGPLPRPGPWLMPAASALVFVHWCGGGPRRSSNLLVAAKRLATQG